MGKKSRRAFFDMNVKERQAYYAGLARKNAPAGLSSPEYVSSLGFYTAGARDENDFSALFIVASGGKQYLLNERMELLSSGYDEIIPYAAKDLCSLLFEVALDGLRGVIDSQGRLVAEVKYEYIYPLSLTRDRDGSIAFEYVDLLACAPPRVKGGGWDVFDAGGTLIFSNLCGVDECEVRREYKHFISSQEVGLKRYAERVESLYIYREYDLSDEENPDYFLEYAFRVSVFDMLLGGAEVRPDERVEIRMVDYPRQLGKLTLRRDFHIPPEQFDEASF